MLFLFFVYLRNSSAQDFALAAKSVKTRKLSQGNLPLAEGDLEWADSVTGKPKAELLRIYTILCNIGEK